MPPVLEYVLVSALIACLLAGSVLWMFGIDKFGVAGFATFAVFAAAAAGLAAAWVPRWRWLPITLGNGRAGAFWTAFFTVLLAFVLYPLLLLAMRTVMYRDVDVEIAVIAAGIGAVFGGVPALFFEYFAARRLLRRSGPEPSSR